MPLTTVKFLEESLVAGFLTFTEKDSCPVSLGFKLPRAAELAAFHKIVLLLTCAPSAWMELKSRALESKVTKILTPVATTLELFWYFMAKFKVSPGLAVPFADWF